MKNIWFNHSFTTTYNFINLVKKNPDNEKFKIFCTHANPNSVMLVSGDHNEIEPELEEDEYIDYCLDFCRKNKIDIFVPGYKKLALIASHYNEFNKAGIKLLLESNNKIIEIINDKSKTYADFIKHKIMDVPEYFIVNNAEKFKTAYERLISHDKQVCFKPVNSQGGSGFRIIDDNADSLKFLLDTPGVRLTYDYAYKVLSSEESFPDLLVSEYMNGTEYSIDCLAYGGKLYAAVPRKKVSGRVRELENNQELIEIAHRFNEVYKLSFIYNIQIRYKDGIPKLLEVNPRMSGGLNTSCLSGINFPYLGIKLLLGEKIDVPIPKFDIMASDIEETIVIK